MPIERTWILLPLAIMLTACSSKRLLENENDRLRHQVIELETSNEKLEAHNRELEAQLAAASARPESVPEEVLRNTPQVAEIALDRLSHARDENDDGSFDTLMLYLDPRDGLGRFIQIVGTVSVNAAILPVDGDAITIGRATFGPDEVREAYRSGVTGVHYAFKLPIEPPAPPAPPNRASEATVRAVYTDGYTGRELSAERTVSLK